MARQRSQRWLARVRMLVAALSAVLALLGAISPAMAAICAASESGHSQCAAPCPDDDDDGTCPSLCDACECGQRVCIPPAGDLDLAGAVLVDIASTRSPQQNDSDGVDLRLERPPQH